jgi:FHA domain-containing protein
MSDLNKKTLRHFYCRDVLWQCFERMSEDFDRGVDDLVNEAMRVFAREKGYIPAEAEVRATSQHSVLPPPPLPSGPKPPPLPPPMRPSQMMPRLSGSSPALAPAETPVPEADGLSAAPPLYLIFQNQRFLIDKDQFIIGRGAKTSDLPIRDGNISRKHCAVIRKNGGYFIKDLGSTNGIDFNGVRVDNRRIEEGDVYSLCDYQLRFTYR